MSCAQIKDGLRLLRAASPRRALNYLLLHITHSASLLVKRPVRGGKPAFVTIEPTSRCNLQCVECPSGKGLIRRTRADITMDTYSKILDGISDSAMFLTLYFQGEPLLHPGLFDMICAAKQKRMYVATSTNAQLLDAETAEKIVLSGLDRIIISFDGPHRESYSAYRKNGDWEKVLAGVMHLADARAKHRSSTPFIILQSLITRHNETRLDVLKKLFRETRADKLELKTMQVLDLSAHSDLLPLDKRYSRYIKNPEGHYQIITKLNNRCFRAWASCVFTCDGDALPCCYDKQGEYVFGNIETHSTKQIWTGLQRNAFLKEVLNNRRGIQICRNCNG